MNNKEYQTMELERFNSETNCYFDSIKDFIISLEDATPRRDLEWIENGSYGAGACLQLQREMESLSPRTNNRARIGAFLLRCLYGKPFRYWHKLPVTIQDKLNRGVNSWMEQEREYAIQLKV